MAKKTDPTKPVKLKEVKITAKPIVHKKDTVVEVGSGRSPRISAPKSKIDSVLANSRSPLLKAHGKAFYGTSTTSRKMDAKRDTSTAKMTNSNKNSSTSDVMYGIVKGLNKSSAKSKKSQLLAKGKKK